MTASILLIKVARLIDGTGSAPVENVAVLVEGGTINSIFRGPVPESAIPPETSVFTFDTGTLLPGLIDSHVHLDLPGDGTAYLDSVAEADGVLVAGATHRARLALEAGITTVRDTGARGMTTFDVRRAQQLGHCIGANLLVCGPPITITGGHTWHFGGEADGVDAVRQKVRHLAKLGADFIKVMGSGGGTPGTMSWLPSFSREELAAIADEAHRQGRRVTVHCLCAASIDYAIDAGVDQIEHAGFIVDAMGRQQLDAAVAERLAKASIPVTSTLAVGEYILATMGAEQDRAPDDGAVRFLDRWKRMRENNVAQLESLHRSGVTFVAGTDAGWRRTPFDALPNEVRWLHEAGLPAMDAIVAATGGAAAALGVEQRLGAIREGLAADLLVVDGNPVEDLRTLREPRLVVQGGIVRASAPGGGVHERIQPAGGRDRVTSGAGVPGTD